MDDAPDTEENSIELPLELVDDGTTIIGVAMVPSIDSDAGDSWKKIEEVALDSIRPRLPSRIVVTDDGVVLGNEVPREPQRRLDWSDDAAARRAIAGCIAMAPSPSAPRPGPEDPPPPEPRSWFAPFVIGLGLLAIFGHLWLFTELFWPTMELRSWPPGAIVMLDGSAAGRTPIDLRVEPGKRHRIELHLEGYQSERRKLIETVGRARTYRLTVQLSRSSS